MSPSAPVRSQVYSSLGCAGQLISWFFYLLLKFPVRTLLKCAICLLYYFSSLRCFFFFSFKIAKQTSYFKVCLSACLLFIRRDSRALCRKIFHGGMLYSRSCLFRSFFPLDSPWRWPDWGLWELSARQRNGELVRASVLSLALSTTSCVTLDRSLKLPRPVLSSSVIGDEQQKKTIPPGQQIV